MSYDDALDDYTHTLEAEIAELHNQLEIAHSAVFEIIELRRQLSESHRQIAILQGQLTHYYL